MAGCAAKIRDETLAVRDLLRSCRIEVNAGEKIRVGFALKKSRKRCYLSIVKPVVRHAGFRMVDSRIPQPSLQPLWLYFGSDTGQLRSHVAAYHVARSVLNRVTRGAERLPIQTRSSRGIG